MERHPLPPREDAVAAYTLELLANRLGVCSGEEMIGRFDEIARAWKLNEQMNEEHYSIPHELHQNRRRRKKIHSRYRTSQERKAAERDERKEEIKKIEEEIQKNKEKMKRNEEKMKKLKKLIEVNKLISCLGTSDC